MRQEIIPVVLSILTEADRTQVKLSNPHREGERMATFAKNDGGATYYFG